MGVGNVLNLYTMEISAEGWLALFKARQWCPLLRLSAPAWLRLLILRPLCHEPSSSVVLTVGSMSTRWPIPRGIAYVSGAITMHFHLMTPFGGT